MQGADLTETIRKTVICDFCLQNTFPIGRDIQAAEKLEDEIDSGRWAACTGCCKLIDEGNWEELIVRGILGTLAIFPESMTRSISLIRRNQIVVMRAVLGERFTLRE